MLKKFFNNRTIVILYDLMAIPASWLLSHWIRHNLGNFPIENLIESVSLLPVIFLCQSISFWSFGLYRGLWRFASIADLLRICKSILFGSGIGIISIFLIYRLETMPRAIIPIYLMTLVIALGAPRFLIRVIKERRNWKEAKRNILIVGAGRAGESLIRGLKRDENQYKPIGIVDDNLKRSGKEVHGIRILGTTKDIPEITKKYNVDMIIIAIPSASSDDVRKIVNLCDETKIPVRILPSLNDMFSGRVNIESLRAISLEDLLGREQVSLDWNAIKSEIKNKSVLVTGGGGSIGSELCRQIASLKPKCLIIIDNSEYNLFKISDELSVNFPKVKIQRFLVSIIDYPAMEKILRSYSIHIIFHAAAYKHVPILENQIRAGVQNNVIGTQIVAQLATQYKVQKFILVSTDKAVNPSSVLGATKRIAEITCQTFNRKTQTKFIIVRFGNVLNSAGSVIPIFKEQLKKGLPLTVTHPEITRFFMTIPEASQLILQASAIGKGGEVFVLDMGEPVKIKFLAEQIIRLSGKKLDTDAKIKYIGLRPGEKLQEELFYNEEIKHKTTHDKILLAKTDVIDEQKIEEILLSMQIACDKCDDFQLKELVLKLIPDLKPSTIERNTLKDLKVTS